MLLRDLSECLGKPIEQLFSQVPFRNWPAERSLEQTEDEASIYYEFPDQGVDIRCDEDELVRTVFLHVDRLPPLELIGLEIDASLTRQQVLERFGPPSKSGNRVDLPPLGKCGAWDRFSRSTWSLHFQYHYEVETIRLVTLMCQTVVP